MIKIIIKENKQILTENRGVRETKEIMKKLFPKILEYNQQYKIARKQKREIEPLEVVINNIKIIVSITKERKYDGRAGGSDGYMPNIIEIYLSPYLFDHTMRAYRRVYMTLLHEILHNIQITEPNSFYGKSTINHYENHKYFRFFLEECKKRFTKEDFIEISKTNNSMEQDKDSDEPDIEIQTACDAIFYHTDLVEVQAFLKEINFLRKKGGDFGKLFNEMIENKSKDVCYRLDPKKMSKPRQEIIEIFKEIFTKIYTAEQEKIYHRKAK